MRWRGHEGCDVPGCEGMHRSRGWCAKHYERYLRYGDPTFTPRIKYGPVCRLPGCGRKTNCRGLCHAHYERWRRRGKVTDNWGLMEIAEPTWQRSFTASMLEAKQQSGPSLSGPSPNMSSSGEMMA